MEREPGSGPRSDDPGSDDPATRRAPTVARVLVPLDGSAASERALPYAAAVARRTGARLALVHVADAADGGAPGDEAPPAAYPRPLLDDPRLAGVPGVEAERLEGPVRDTLLRRADAGHADLVVMTGRGRGGLRRALLGSVADALVRSAELPPVLLVRGERGAPAADGAAPFRRALLPLDGSRLAEEVVEPALAVTGTAGVHVHLLRVHPALTPEGLPAPGPIFGGEPGPGGDGYLSSTAARLADRGLLVSTHAPTHASPADVIVRLADEQDVDLVAMTTRGLGGADRAIFGSVTDQVLRRSPCPVLVVRPAAG